MINVRVRSTSLGATTPIWSKIMAQVTVEGSAVWKYGDTLGDGDYCLEKSL